MLRGLYSDKGSNHWILRQPDQVSKTETICHHWSSLCVFNSVRNHPQHTNGSVTLQEQNGCLHMYVRTCHPCQRTGWIVVTVK